MEEHKHHSEHHHAHHKGPKIKKTDILKSIIAILAVLLIASIFTSGFKGIGGKTLSKDVAAEKAVTFINENILAAQGTSAEMVSVEEKNNLYNVKLNINGQEFDSYITKDASVLFPNAIDLTEASADAGDDTPPATPPPTEVEKSDKPEVELFIMSHCPFGTQAEKGIIPAIKLLGNKIDFKLRFVNYAMHGEKEINEQINQYCIQKEQKSKLIPYLECFLEAGDGEACLKTAKIDVDKMEECVEAADEEFKVTESLENQEGKFPAFLPDDELNKKYGVRGSPTLIVNGADSNAGRSSSSYLSGICAAFNEAPEECGEELSSANPSSGFGYNAGTASGGAAAQCG